MKSFLFILFLSIHSLFAVSQQKDSVTGNIKSTIRGNIISTGPKYNVVNRALVVGVSQYQQIHGLQYADKDAEEFSNFLVSNPNWKVEADNIKLLLNDKAKLGDVIVWLTWLLENSKEGDNVLFYFSGHGDVETIGEIDKGFLLTYDCPKNNYITGALGVDVLQNIFTEMLNKGIKVYIVTDACRSGHLAGGAAGAAQTAKAFSKQWKNETKILSSQPDEVSYEGPQWGNGRGVFSFYLLKGLNGFADLNKDSSVTLSELEQYVGLQVSEATGYKQQPIFEGASKFSAKISKADTSGMNRYQQWKSESDISVFVLKEKGTLWNQVDNVLSAYPRLKRLLKDSLISPEIINSGWPEYALFKNVLTTSQVKENVRFQLTATLLNYLQQLVNQSLLGKKLVGKEMQLYALGVVDRIEEINKGFRLINRSHLDNVRRYFFINSIVMWSDFDGMKQNRPQILSMLDSAFAVEPKAAYLLHTKAMVYKMEGKIDSAVVYLQQASKSSPTWLVPKYLLGMAMEEKGKIKEALQYYEEIILLDTTYQSFECALCFYMNMGEIYLQQKQYKSAELVYKKGYALDTLSFDMMEGLFDVAVKTNDTNKKNIWLGKIKAASKTTSDNLNYLQLLILNKLITVKETLNLLDSLEAVVNTKEEKFLHYYTRGLAKEIFGITHAEDEYDEAYQINPYDFDCISNLLNIYITKGSFTEAEQLVDEALPRFTGWRRQGIRYYQAVSYAYNQKEEEALSIFKELIQQDLMDCKEVKKIKPLKNAPSFKDFSQSCK